MKIAGTLQNIYQRAKTSLGEAVVGDDFFRRDGTVDGIALGASTGAAVGGVIGASRGLYHQAADEVTEVPVRRTITDPKLGGFRYYVRADWDTDCHGTDEHRHCDTELDGWWHSYRPNVEERVVGIFTEPTLQHSHDLTVVGSAATGAAIGAGVGAALGLATGVVGRAMGGHPMKRDKPLPPEIREQLVESGGETVIKGTVIGAGVGAAVGLGAGLLEQSKAASITRTYNAPIMESRDLGSIPRDHYEWNWGWDWNRPGDYSRHSPRGDKPVIRQAPVLDAKGEPRMRAVTEQLDSARFGPVSGMLGGAAVGAGVGFAAGVATSIVNRMLVQSGVE